jgi:S-DNA-T family DNA segregation ATPase FtsK/SpoIIIE
MSSVVDYYKDTITRMNRAVADYREGILRITREYEAVYDRLDKSLRGAPGSTANQLADDRKQADIGRAKRILNWQSVFAKDWEKTAAVAARSSAELFRTQPPLIDFRRDHPSMASGLPAAISLGSHCVSFEQFSCRVPCIVPFPLASPIALSDDNAAHKRLAHELLLRLLSALPPGQLELTLIDPLQLGQSLTPFLSLLKVTQLVPQQRVLTRSDEIEAALGALTDEVEDLIQHRFNDKAATWSAYNTAHPASALPYKVLLLSDVPEQLSDKSLWFLERLCENGPRCGVLPILTVNVNRMEDRRYAKLRATVQASAMAFDALLAGTQDGCDGLSFAYQPEQWPRQDALDGFFSTLTQACADKARFSRSLPDLWTHFTRGTTSISGFDIPIGWTPAGEPVSLILGATTSEHHALLAGKTGSGKSNLLHVLIHTLCEKYDPAELDLYLLDYKESTEFNIYAAPPLPHARLVATESDPEYGITVLRHLVEELEQRARMFKQAGVRDFAEYRHAGIAQLPRILLVIDEFQVLFSEKRQVAEAAEQLLSQLLKQGRSFGIHILLATQTLKGINAQSISSLITQLGSRIALACGQEDSAMILGGNNLAAAELRSPPEGIINNVNGAKSGNVKFLIPLAEPTLCHEHLAEFAARAASAGMLAKTRIFSGAHLPELPSPGEFAALCGPGEILLGERLTFDTDALTVPLTRRSACNVLFSGYDDQIHDGLLASTLSSIAVAGDFDEIVVFNGRGVVPGGGVPAAAQALGTRFTAYDDIAALPLQAIVDGIGTRRVALIIDGLDAEKALHPAPSFRVPKPGEPPSPADLLKRLAEDGPRKGTFVFVFVDRWQRCAGACKDLFAFFELRAAYCMNEDDAGSLVSGGIGKFKGIEKSNRAVFVNRMTNEIAWFRPYIRKSSP